MPSGAFAFHPGEPRIAVISNPRSRRNATVDLARKIGSGVFAAAPTTRAELAETLRIFAARRIDLLVIDGGDGTIRDVLTAAADVFGDDMPAIALSPSGKTNALANDLGVPTGWSVEDAVAAWRSGTFRTRAPIDIHAGGRRLRGFILGIGGFVRATRLAQRAHHFGAIGGLAVGLSLLGAVVQTLFGGPANPWRVGERVGVTQGGRRREERRVYVLIASTLQRLPLGIRALGRTRPGLNALVVDAPPRFLPLVVAGVVTGREGGAMVRLGCHHAHDVPRTELELEHGFILDGELFPGGTVTVEAGAPLRFVVP